MENLLSLDVEGMTAPYAGGSSYLTQTVGSIKTTNHAATLQDLLNVLALGLPSR